MESWSMKKMNKVIRRLLESYNAKGVHFAIKPRVIPLPGDRLKLRVQFLPETKVADLKRYANDVRLSLKLAVLQVMEEAKSVYLVISKELLEKENHLQDIISSDEYCEAQKEMGLALPIGISDLGDPFIVDLTSPGCPHIAVSGTTGAGKTVALRAILTTIITRYRPSQVNLLIGDKAADLSQFKGLPHLSYPLIEDFDTLLKVMLVLKKEMDRRIAMKENAVYRILPIIVVVIDEFNSFMSDSPSKEMTCLAVETITKILRMGRHAKIHMILAAHNPTRENMKIDTSDLPVKMAFQVANTHNSVTALGEGGAEKLKGNGDMLFKMNGQILHLQGAYISEKISGRIIEGVRQQPMDKTEALIPRGLCGFTVRDKALQRMEEKLQNETTSISPSSVTRQNSQNNTDLLFAKIIVWALNQEEISCNMLSEQFGIGWRRANNFISELNELGIVSDLDAKLPRKVLIRSEAKLPRKALNYLTQNGVSGQQ